MCQTVSHKKKEIKNINIAYLSIFFYQFGDGPIWNETLSVVKWVSLS